MHKVRGCFVLNDSAKKTRLLHGFNLALLGVILCTTLLARDTSVACPERPILPFPIAQEKANPADNEDSNPVLKFPGEVPAHHEYIKVAGERKNGR